ncbi:hypothetical protein CEXT_109501 [Caerostris extrusa]|uniref:Uncharacterized protein n=1 Tax=Caerostris extrusa TaxID=172846 RepID=A0AAV4WUA5_CAEEX|nr:hypothetical protein CEXT_109501 [Caerostris extrusa]
MVVHMSVKRGKMCFSLESHRASHKNSFVFAFARFSAPIQELNALRGRLVRDRVRHSPRPTLNGFMGLRVQWQKYDEFFVFPHSCSAF